jgi:hypothetical protein
VSQSFLSVFPDRSVGTMATCLRCCHLPGEMLNLATKAADRARISNRSFIPASLRGRPRGPVVQGLCPPGRLEPTNACHARLPLFRAHAPPSQPLPHRGRNRGQRMLVLSLKHASSKDCLLHGGQGRCEDAIRPHF